jgi:aspartyl-tRNA(Asn)/glutamyl-tRNA(Gln) amidotransferase subunit A
VSVKDLFDIAGLPTTAGSVVLADAPPALVDAPAVRRLREAGAVVVGRTNMTEFAYSGIGQNPHHGIPRNPYDREIGRIPGGSSSGAAISVTDGMCAVAIGTDTGGSVRIPAALTGLVGWKPTADRVPREGLIPLSPTLDSVGPLARSVADVAFVDAVLAGETPAPLPPRSPSGLRLLAPQNLVLEAMDAGVAAAYASALERLREAGVTVVEADFSPLESLAYIHRRATFGGAESWAWHRDLLAREGHRYDPRVRVRIEMGEGITPEDVETLVRERAAWRESVREASLGFDALVWPTVPIVAPRIAELATERGFSRLNSLVLRNTFIVNFLDGCATSLPCQPPGALPVGLMVVGGRNDDAAILSISSALEPVLMR